MMTLKTKRNNTMATHTLPSFKTASFAADIDKETLNSLPKATFHGRIIIVDTLRKLHSAIKALETVHLVGVDTETKPNFIPGKKVSVALLQVSTLEVCYLFRLNLIGFPEELKKFLERADLLKIGLSLRDDISRLKSMTDFNPIGFIELQQMASAYGIQCASLQKIYGITHGLYMSKAQRMTNWEAPILTDNQQAYAALDAQACLEIYLKFMDEEHPHPAQFGLITL